MPMPKGSLRGKTYPSILIYRAKRDFFTKKVEIVFETDKEALSE